jgi:hypothetical protein
MRPWIATSFTSRSRARIAALTGCLKRHSVENCPQSSPMRIRCMSFKRRRTEPSCTRDFSDLARILSA